MNPATARHSVDIWGPRLVTSVREARRRTALVHIIRLLFTVGAVLSAGLLIGPAIQHATTAGSPHYATPTVSATMIGPEFKDVDASGRPYVVTADTARQRRATPSLVDLVNPRLSNEAKMSVQALEGLYDRSGQILDLKGKVVMEDATGNRFESESVRMYLKDGRIEGRSPLHGKGPIGEVRSDSYEVLEDGQKIVLHDNIRVQFNARRERQRSAAGGN